MITKETLEKIESETKGPKTFYETSNLAGENINEGKVETKDKSASFVTPFKWMKRNILPFFGFLELQRGY